MFQFSFTHLYFGPMCKKNIALESDRTSFLSKLASRWPSVISEFNSSDAKFIHQNEEGVTEINRNY